MRVALYLRRSTNDLLQADSLEAQEEVLRAHAASHSFEVVATYRDSASGRSVENRDAFHSLLRDAERRHFDAVLVRDVSRFGRFLNIDEAAYWEFVLLMRGVQVLYVEELFGGGDTPYGALLKTIRRFAAAEFSRDKARLVQFAKYRAVRNGFWPGGEAPYGMARMLVRNDGTPVQPLAFGERKILSGQHTKLSPGDPHELHVVRRIFSMAAEGIMAGPIAARLNADSVPSPRGRFWKTRTVDQLLQNVAYIGCASATFGSSQNFAEAVHILTENAWAPVVPREVFEAAAKWRAQRTEDRSPAGLARQLRERFERWGVALPSACVPERASTDDTYRKYFASGPSEALEVAYQPDIEELWEGICERLAAEFQLERRGTAVVLNGVLRVGYKVAFPSAHRCGRVAWAFRFDGNEEDDVTLGLALSPPPLHVQAYFRYITRRIATRRCTRMPRPGSANTSHAALRDIEAVVMKLRSDLLRNSSIIEQRFIESARKRARINVYAIAREIGVPEPKGTSIYRALMKRAIALPPLERQFGRRITLVCDDCGVARSLRICNAMLHKSALCAPCWRLRRAKWRTCPDCGDRRRLGSGEAKRLRNGVNSRCRRCELKARPRRPITKRDAKGRIVGRFG